MPDKKKLRKTRLFIVFWIVLALLCATFATYAWFSFNPATNIEPMSSTVSKGRSSLLISNSSTGDFAAITALAPVSEPEELRPVSTADLSNYFTATAHDLNGISVLYEDVSANIGDYLIYGTVYLKSINGACDIYFYKSGLSFGTDTQALAALRLGLAFTTESGTSTYVFKLDDMGDTTGASATLTTPESDKVVNSLNSDSTANYSVDTAFAMSDFFAVENGANDETPDAGQMSLASINQDEIAPVEYWLYLEGCDENCINAVQSRDISLQLAFAGVTREAE